MLHALARNWWALLIRGIAAVLFGVLAFVWPNETIFVLVILFGAYAFVDGIFALISAIRAAEAKQRWWPFLLEGIVGLVIAAIVVFHPSVAALALYFTIAIWAIITGILEIVAAVQLRKLLPNEIWLIISGVLSIAFGVLLFVFPQYGFQTVIFLIGFYAIFFGIVMIVFSFRLRRHATPA
jgi:uncharacterized membrane protein HdeD (DUF308 family)